MAMTLAFIGLGAMGRPTAMHLIKAGYQLRLYARRVETAQPLLERGAVACTSASDAAQNAAVVFINVTSTADVEEVLFGDQGVMKSAKAGTVVIDHSTISATATQRFAARLAQNDIHMLDCPVSGGVRGAEAASLAIMVGGSAQVLEQMRPLLNVLGRSITHVGGHGAGQIAKACNQMVQVTTIQAIAEAMLFAQAQSVDPEKILAAISPGFAGSKMLDLMGPKMATRDFAAGIEARLHHKDFGLITEMAHEQHLALPLTAQVMQQLNALMHHGWGKDDTSSLLRVLEEMNGVCLSK